MRQVQVRSLQRVDQMFVLTMAAYNLVCMLSSGKIRLRGKLRERREQAGSTRGKAEHRALKYLDVKWKCVPAEIQVMPSLARGVFQQSARLQPASSLNALSSCSNGCSTPGAAR